MSSSDPLSQTNKKINKTSYRLGHRWLWMSAWVPLLDRVPLAVSRVSAAVAGIPERPGEWTLSCTCVITAKG